jgi:hypothetical protein
MLIARWELLSSAARIDFPLESSVVTELESMHALTVAVGVEAVRFLLITVTYAIRGVPCRVQPFAVSSCCWFSIALTIAPEATPASCAGTFVEEVDAGIAATDARKERSAVSAVFFEIGTAGPCGPVGPVGAAGPVGPDWVGAADAGAFISPACGFAPDTGSSRMNATTSAAITTQAMPTVVKRRFRVSALDFGEFIEADLLTGVRQE